MESVVLVVHLIIAVALILTVLLQRSEGGGLGIGSSGGMGNLATARGAADFMTRMTAFLATGFMITSLTLGIMAGAGKEKGSILQRATDAPIAATDEVEKMVEDLKADVEEAKEAEVVPEAPISK